MSRRAWFTREEFGDGVTRITEPHAHPLLRASVWHLRGTRDLWIDAGLGVFSLPAAFPELCGRDPLLFVTHAHVDHAGGADAFDEVVMHPLEIATPSESAMPLDAATVAARLGLSPEALPDRLPEMLVDTVPGDDGTTVRSGNGPARPRPVVEGARIDAGDREFVVLELPGHTPGSIGLWCEQTGTLVTGDALYSGTLIDDLPGSDRADYRRTMRRIIELEPSTVLPGHGPPLDGAVATAIAREYLDSRTKTGE